MPHPPSPSTQELVKALNEVAELLPTQRPGYQYTASHSEKSVEAIVGLGIIFPDRVGHVIFVATELTTGKMEKKSAGLTLDGQWLDAHSPSDTGNICLKPLETYSQRARRWIREDASFEVQTFAFGQGNTGLPEVVDEKATLYAAEVFQVKKTEWEAEALSENMPALPSGQGYRL